MKYMMSTTCIHYLCYCCVISHLYHKLGVDNFRFATKRCSPAWIRVVVVLCELSENLSHLILSV